ncbi:uncharacterized protein LOC117090907 [Trachypithecus francoisi]|uniref:uncharacterized protein LOC117090907 n=1 Tax=Trachypithecus francoisi TaxID=54180 RepID=UPI00141B8E63|nr:uncharacterized protein LOC117090907 [Trachypithecus francoisi]
MSWPFHTMASEQPGCRYWVNLDIPDLCRALISTPCCITCAAFAVQRELLPWETSSRLTSATGCSKTCRKRGLGGARQELLQARSDFVGFVGPSLRCPVSHGSAGESCQMPVSCLEEHSPKRCLPPPISWRRVRPHLQTLPHRVPRHSMSTRKLSRWLWPNPKSVRWPVPMPSKRRSLDVQISMDTYTPPAVPTRTEGKARRMNETHREYTCSLEYTCRSWHGERRCGWSMATLPSPESGARRELRCELSMATLPRPGGGDWRELR